MGNLMRRAVLVLALMGGAAAGAAADCVYHISSGLGDDPLTGTLLGEKTVTGRIGSSALAVSASYTETYTIGAYRMSDGSVMHINCFDYTLYDPLPV